MSLYAKGCYFDSREDHPYEVETTNRLKYYISSALISVDCILKPIESMVSRCIFIALSGGIRVKEFDKTFTTCLCLGKEW